MATFYRNLTRRIVEIPVNGDIPVDFSDIELKTSKFLSINELRESNHVKRKKPRKAVEESSWYQFKRKIISS